MGNKSSVGTSCNTQKPGQRMEKDLRTVREATGGGSMFFKGWGGRGVIAGGSGISGKRGLRYKKRIKLFQGQKSKKRPRGDNGL